MEPLYMDAGNGFSNITADVVTRDLDEWFEFGMVENDLFDYQLLPFSMRMLPTAATPSWGWSILSSLGGGLSFCGFIDEVDDQFEQDPLLTIQPLGVALADTMAGDYRTGSDGVSGHFFSVTNATVEEAFTQLLASFAANRPSGLVPAGIDFVDRRQQLTGYTWSLPDGLAIPALGEAPAYRWLTLFDEAGYRRKYLFVDGDGSLSYLREATTSLSIPTSRQAVKLSPEGLPSTNVVAWDPYSFLPGVNSEIIAVEDEAGWDEDHEWPTSWTSQRVTEAQAIAFTSAAAGISPDLSVYCEFLYDFEDGTWACVVANEPYFGGVRRAYYFSWWGDPGDVRLTGSWRDTDMLKIARDMAIVSGGIPRFGWEASGDGLEAGYRLSLMPVAGYRDFTILDSSITGHTRKERRLAIKDLDIDVLDSSDPSSSGLSISSARLNGLLGWYQSGQQGVIIEHEIEHVSDRVTNRLTPGDRLNGYLVRRIDVNAANPVLRKAYCWEWVS